MPINEVEVQDYLDSIEEYEGDEEGDKDIQNEIEDLKHEVNELKRQLNCYTTSNDKFIFALHLMHGNKIERDVNLAIEELKLVSDGGNSYASYLLYLHYSDDQSEEIDFIKAKKYFERMSEQCNSAGFNGIGYVHEHGYEVERNYI